MQDPSTFSQSLTVSRETIRVACQKLKTAVNMGDDISPDLLQQQRIPDLPPSMYYIPDFITGDEEQRMLDKVGSNGVVFKEIHQMTNQTSDTSQSMDFPHPPPSPSHTRSAHCKQYTSRLFKIATLAHKPGSRPYHSSGSLRRRTARSQSLLDQRVSSRAGHHAP